MSVSKLALCLIIMNELIEALKKEVVVITFKKIDTGDIRVMPSTLNPELIPESTSITKYISRK